MKFAHALGWVNTRIILTLFFFIIFTPITLLLRLFTRDHLGLKINKDIDSYWTKIEHKEFDKLQYEKQF